LRHSGDEGGSEIVIGLTAEGESFSTRRGMDAKISIRKRSVGRHGGTVVGRRPKQPWMWVPIGEKTGERESALTPQKGWGGTTNRGAKPYLPLRVWVEEKAPEEGEPIHMPHGKPGSKQVRAIFA